MDPTTSVTDLVLQGGAGALLLVALGLFLRHLRQSDKDNKEEREKATERFTTTLDRIVDKHDAGQSKIAESLDTLTEKIAKVCSSIEGG